MKGSSTCEKLLQGLQDEASRQTIMLACFNMPPDLDIKKLMKSNDPHIKWFSDPCESSSSKVAQEIMVALVLLLQTIRITFSITLDASLAYEEVHNFKCH
jgi:hypothetical protein